MTRVSNLHYGIIYDSHTLSLHIVANSLRKNVKIAKNTLKKQQQKKTKQKNTQKTRVALTGI
jgi:hypothetical protein